MLSDIAGYVGADTCGCLLAIRQDQQEEISLMIDIGTNGEMVLGNRERMRPVLLRPGLLLRVRRLSVECVARPGLWIM